jgi:hypothetical protein
MDSNKIINMSAVSKVLCGNSSTVRSTRISPTLSPQVKELADFVDEWVAKYSRSTTAVLTIKTTK